MKKQNATLSSNACGSAARRNITHPSQRRKIVDGTCVPHPYHYRTVAAKIDYHILPDITAQLMKVGLSKIKANQTRETCNAGVRLYLRMYTAVYVDNNTQQVCLQNGKGQLDAKRKAAPRPVLTIDKQNRRFIQLAFAGV